MFRSRAAYKQLASNTKYLGEGT